MGFVGLLLVKKLLSYNPAKALPVSAFQLGILPEAKPTINCFQALDYFQTRRAHLLLISSTPGVTGGAMGVITLWDIIEEILSEEIVDETDRYEDNQSKKRAKRITTTATMRGIVERQRGASTGERTPLLGPNILPVTPIKNGDVSSIKSVTYGSLDSDGPMIPPSPFS